MKDPSVNHDDEASPETGTLTPTLLDGALKNDELAWQRIVALYGPLVVQWCRQKNLLPEEAADVSQDVFQTVKLELSKIRLDRKGDRFRKWLRVVARGKIVDHFRKRAKDIHGAGGTDYLQRMNMIPARVSSSSASDHKRNERIELLRCGLELIKGEFTEKTWRAFWFVTVDGRPVADVAKELGLTPGAVHIAKHRVLKRFREYFKGFIA
jgi:RNA polymerase sigma factor (sigma-70 family)